VPHCACLGHTSRYRPAGCPQISVPQVGKRLDRRGCRWLVEAHIQFSASTGTALKIHRMALQRQLGAAQRGLGQAGSQSLKQAVTKAPAASARPSRQSRQVRSGRKPALVRCCQGKPARSEILRCTASRGPHWSECGWQRTLVSDAVVPGPIGRTQNRRGPHASVAQDAPRLLPLPPHRSSPMWQPAPALLHLQPRRCRLIC